MKKMMTVLAAVAVAGVVSADLAVQTKNSAALLREGFTELGPGQGLQTGAFLQLVWYADDSGYQDGADIDLADATLGSGLLSDGGYVLTSGFTTGPVGNIDLGVGVYTDANVGGAAINSGAFYARIYSAAVPGGPVQGSAFLEMGLQSGPLTAYSASDPTTIYSDNLNDLGTVSIDSQGTTVVPEPATIGLMGIAGLGMFLARRKARR